MNKEIINKITKLGNDELAQRTKELTVKERKLSLYILHHLREVQRRRLYARLGFSSLFKYCTQELLYSESAAQRRIDAMKLINDCPEVEEKISEGKLNLSVVTTAQVFFRQEAKMENKDYTKTDKLEVLKQLEGKSRREAEKKLVEISPSAVKSLKDRERPISPEYTEIRFVLTKGQMEKLERLKELKGPGLTNSKAIEWMLDSGCRETAIFEPKKAQLSLNVYKIRLLRSDHFYVQI